VLADAGSTPATSTNYQTGLEPSRPVNSLPDQTLTKPPNQAGSVSAGLKQSRFGHRFDTNWAQQATSDFGTLECRMYRNRIFEALEGFSHVVGREYLRIANERSYIEANRQLGNRKKQIIRGDLNLAHPDSALRLFSKDKASICFGYREALSEQDAADRSVNLARKYQIPLSQTFDENSVYALNRLCDQDWWYRKVRKLRNRVLSEIERDIGIVSHRIETYSSDRSLRSLNYREQKQKQFLERQVLRNHLNEEFSLADVASKNISNPAIRRAELMTRIKGFEHIAKLFGHDCLFVTLTTPSRMHRTHKKSGRPNKKFDGTTPREANQYLLKSWQRMRAKLDRDGIRVYGFRVAEPHHDGTPHWHLLLFLAPEKTKQVKSIIRHHSLRDAAQEKGALTQRVKFEDIDPAKGSATAYIAKYISKNIDGEHLDTDTHGNNGKSTARRINAWASDHSIRQFQQFGGPSVTVWRELRKLREPVSNPAIETARCAADTSDWAEFTLAMGGTNLPAGKRPIKPYRDHVTAIDIATGEIIVKDTNKYGEPSQKPIRGLATTNDLISTRRFVWSTNQKLEPLEIGGFAPALGEAQSSANSTISSGTWTCVNNCTENSTRH